MKKLLFNIILFSFLLANSVNAQNECAVHIDKSFYVTGEIIWYKLYLPTFIKGNNTVIKTTLLDAAGNNIGNHYTKSDETTFVTGYYKLPFGLNSEVYSLVFSGTRSKSSPEEIFAEVFIPVYNDLQSVPSTDQINDVSLNSYNSKHASSNNLKIDVSLDKDAYACREEVKAKISVTDANGNPIKSNISVTVRDVEIISAKTSTPNFYSGKDIDAEGGLFMNQIYIKGSYVKGDGEIVPKEIMGAYAAKENKLHFSVPDMNGNFHLELPYYHGPKTIQFFPFIDDDKDLKVSLKNIGSANSKTLAYNEEIIEYIKLSRQRKKLFQRYTSVESNIQPKEYKTEVAAFDFDKEFDITEYESFENVASFLREVKTPLRMKEKKGKYEGAMYMPTKWNSYSDYADTDPIYIVNGYLTNDSDFIGGLDLDLVTNLSMLYEPKKIRKAYKIFGANGVVGVTVKSKDITIPDANKNDIFNISGLLPETSFPKFDPTDIEGDQFQPFFRPQLFWDGNLSTDSSGSTSFSYFQSDDVSTFVIEVIAQAEDGSISTASKTYQSVWQQP